jgi:hypothetical protein
MKKNHKGKTVAVSAVAQEGWRALLDVIEEEYERYEARVGRSGEIGGLYFQGVANGLNMVRKHMQGVESMPGPLSPLERQRKKKRR